MSEVIPDWITKYDEANYQSGAGKAVRELITQLKAVQAECFHLAAGQCLSPAGDEWGHFYCVQMRKLEQERDDYRSRLEILAEFLIAGERTEHDIRYQYEKILTLLSAYPSEFTQGLVEKAFLAGRSKQSWEDFKREMHLK